MKYHSVTFQTILCLLGTFISFYTYGQDKKGQVDKIFNFATSATPGCSCTINQNGKTIVSSGYGKANLTGDVLITESTVFDIGSTRKQFIAAVMLMLVQDKSVCLTDDIRKYLPEMPDYGRKITIDHLLTHTSGVRDWTGILPLAKGDPTAVDLILKQRGLNFGPGEEWSYSNSGYVLLTKIAERITKLRFADLIQERLFKPLGMKNTLYTADMKIEIANRAIGYAKQGDGWKIDMYLGNDRGGGAIFSTTADLAIWNNALDAKKLGDFISGKLQEPTMLNNGRKLDYARGLTLDNFRGAKLIWHSGGAAGYHTWIGRIPEQQLSIALACNSDAMSTTAISKKLLALYGIPSTGAPGEEGPPATLYGDALTEANSYTGLYFEEYSYSPLVLAIDNDRFRVADGPGLAPVSKGRYRRWGNSVFFMSQDKFEINFISTESFQLRSMEGKIRRYRRARPYTPAISEVMALSGHYASAELNADLEVLPDNGNLTLRLNDGRPYVFKCVERDIYQLSGVFLRIIRDSGGKAIAINYRNPVVSNITFAKQQTK